MKRLISMSIVTALLAAALIQTAGSQEIPTPKVFMRSKLDHSQKLLEALVLEDFKGMAKESQALSLLSLAASWQVLQTPEYAQQSLEFRRAADAIHNASDKKNLDGAALAYVEMTMKCVNCHKYVRGTRIAATEPGKPRLSLAKSLAVPPEPVSSSSLRKVSGR